MAFFYCDSAKYLNSLKVRTDFYRPSDKQISYVTVAECNCSAKSKWTRVGPTPLTWTYLVDPTYTSLLKKATRVFCALPAPASVAVRNSP